MTLLSENQTAAGAFESKATHRVLDELFSAAKRYRTGTSFQALLKFVGGFRSYAPYNAMIVHAQMPGARYVAPAHRWWKLYGRRIKPDGRALVILQPSGPVMFVFDVSDTEPTEARQPLPLEIEKPFEVKGLALGGQVKHLIENAKRDGIRITPRKEGSQSAGQIAAVDGKNLAPLFFPYGRKSKDGKQPHVACPVRYDLVFNDRFEPLAQYATMAHELAHLYCGHLGTPNTKWWPDRRGLSHQTQEFEAESVTYLLCQRLGIDNPSVGYLSGYVESDGQIPAISVECVMKASGLIESMGKKRLPVRKDK